MSRAASAQYGVPCRTCNVAADEPCRSRGSRRITDTHASRRGDYWRQQNAALAEEYGTQTTKPATSEGDPA